MKIFPIFILCAAISTQALPHPDQHSTNNDRVVGGADAEPHSTPHKVSLQTGIIRPAHFCAGVIIHSNWVLTTAHCIGLYPAIGINTVVAGLHDLSNFQGVEQVRQVTLSDTWTHENFDGWRGPHDIGLILLPTPFVFDNYLNSIPLPVADTHPSGVATLHGWGSTSYEWFQVWPNILQTAELVIVPLETCRNNWPWSGIIGENHVCAGSTAASACMRDDGGALVQDGVAIAFVSFGFVPCGLNDRPAVFTRISAYISWIDNVINNARVK